MPTTLRKRIRRRKSRRILFESLESRWLLAGDVAVSLPGQEISDAPAHERVRVIVELASPEKADAVIGSLGSKASNVRRMTELPILVLELPEPALDGLAHSPHVVAVQRDESLPPALASTLPVINGNDAHTLGYDGSGTTIVVLDTGIDEDHDFFGTNGSRIISQVCFSNPLGSNEVSLCPNGESIDNDANIAGLAACLDAEGNNICDHGTHVTGIAAGSAATDTANAPGNGVAPGANIVAMQVFHRVNSSTACSPSPAPCVSANVSDIISALDSVLALNALNPAWNIAAVNMSLGGGEFATACDTSTLKRPIDDLLAAGIATVVAAGNDGLNAGVSLPGCISTAFTVGSTTDADTVSLFSNRGTLLDVFAPGGHGCRPINVGHPSCPPSDVESSEPDDDYGSKAGTSMAAPHVAGALAVLRQKFPLKTINDLMTSLTVTGVPIEYSSGGADVTTPRIDLLAAIEQRAHAAELTAIETAKLVSTNSSDDELGAAVAIDGDTAVVGAPGDENDPGSVLVYARSGSTWSLQERLTASDAEAEDRFGTSVAIDGDTIVIGATERLEANGLGAAYVFTRSGASWSEQAKLTASRSGWEFGKSVAISGNTLVVGQSYNNSLGRAYIFSRNSGDPVWRERTRLGAADAPGFGSSISIDRPTSSSNFTIAVGADLDNSAHMFTWSGNELVSEGELVPSDGAFNHYFGTSVAVEGNTVVVGSPGNAAGAAYVFERGRNQHFRTEWFERAKLSPLDGEPGDSFGHSVSMSGDAMVVGAVWDDEQGTASGSAYAFKRFDTSWFEQDKFVPSRFGESDWYGTAISLSGRSVVVGTGEFSNAAYTFDLLNTEEIPSLSLVNQTTSLAEDTNTASGVKVADVVVTDDGVGTNILSLKGTDAGLFEIQGTDLRLKAGTSLDFETKPSLAVTVEVDDPAIGLTPEDSVSLVVAVTNVNEPPSVALANPISDLPENLDTASSLKVADIIVTDDTLGTNNLSLAGTDAALFEIQGADLRLKAGTGLDFETKPSLAITVEVNDNTIPGTPDDAASLAIAVTDVNEPPFLSLSSTSVTVVEGETAINSGTLADVDFGDVVSLSTSVGAVGNNGNGTWSWALATNDSAQTQTVFVTALDLAGAETTVQFDLVVEDLACLDVTHTADDGSPNSLREAIRCANATPGHHTIHLAAGTYGLTIGGAGENAAATGDLDVTDHLTVVGAGMLNTVIDASALSESGFELQPSIVVNLSGLTISGGTSGIFNRATNNLSQVKITGASISGLHNSGRMTLEDSAVAGNSGGNGGGILNGGTMSLVGTLVTGNSATFSGGGIFNNAVGVLTISSSHITSNNADNGGGIFNQGTLSVTESRIDSNSSNSSGGGIYHSFGGMALERTTVSDNSASTTFGSGGGIFANAATTLLNTTVSGNAADQGGGIQFFVNGPFSVINSTITNNTATTKGGGADGAGAKFGNSIIAGNLAPIGPDLADSSGQGHASLGHNLVGIAHAGLGFTDGLNADQVGTSGSPIDPLLSLLQDHGGPTPTHALLPGSPALNSGNNGLAPNADQRGASRPDGNPGSGSTVDIGAYEFIPDTDGVAESVEDGAPNGGDGNGDGLPDSQQAHVASLPNTVDSAYITLIGSPVVSLGNVTATGSPSPSDQPIDTVFPLGFLEFDVVGVPAGGATAVQLLAPAGTTISTYYKYGPTPDDPTDHWYEFLFDGMTGAEINGNEVTLHFVDGQRGDDDLIANGVIVDPGALARSPLVAVGDTDSLVEDAVPNTVSGNLLANDLHTAGTTLSVVAASGSSANVGLPLATALGTILVESDGDYTYTLDNGLLGVQSLASGQTATDTVPYTAHDGTNLAAGSLVITVHGSNDTPNITVGGLDAAMETLIETDSALSAAGTLSVEDLDTADTVNVSVSSLAVTGDDGGIGTPALRAMMQVDPVQVIDDSTSNGQVNWFFNNGSVAFNHLADGQALVLRYTLTAADSQSASDAQDVVITIEGTNDTPNITLGGGDSAAKTLIETNAGLSTAGTLSVEDLDTTDVVTAAVNSLAVTGDSGGIGDTVLRDMLSVDAGPVIDNTHTTGKINWSFDSGGVAFDHLAVNESLVLRYTLTATDSQAAVDTRDVVITIEGRNDSPDITVGVLDSAAETLTETDSGLFVAGTLSVEDLDTTDTVTVSVTSLVVVGDDHGLGNTELRDMMSVDAGQVIDNASTSGKINWSFDSGNVAFDHLAADESLVLRYSLTALDSQSATDTQEVTITIEGSNDRPSIRQVTSSNPTLETRGTADSPVTVNGTFFDADSSDTHLVTVDWGDGLPAQAVTVTQDSPTTQEGTFADSHSYLSGGIYTITVTIQDGSRATHTQTSSAVIVGAGRVGDTVYVIGTERSDKITVNQQGNGLLRVHADFLHQSSFTTIAAAGATRLIAHLFAGDDHFSLAANVQIPAIVRGGDDHDELIGGGGPTVLLGGSGIDLLLGGSGRDLLVGGSGQDELVGGNDEDVLIGGSTQQDDDDEALLAILAAWTSADEYATRVAAVDALVAVEDDGHVDLLTGSSGRDLFYDGLGDVLNLTKKKKDPETVL